MQLTERQRKGFFWASRALALVVGLAGAFAVLGFPAAVAIPAAIVSFLASQTSEKPAKEST